VGGQIKTKWKLQGKTSEQQLRTRGRGTTATGLGGKRQHRIGSKKGGGGKGGRATSDVVGDGSGVKREPQRGSENERGPERRRGNLEGKKKKRGGRKRVRVKKELAQVRVRWSAFDARDSGEGGGRPSSEKKTRDREGVKEKKNQSVETQAQITTGRKKAGLKR